MLSSTLSLGIKYKRLPNHQRRILRLFQLHCLQPQKLAEPQNLCLQPLGGLACDCCCHHHTSRGRADYYAFWDFRDQNDDGCAEAYPFFCQTSIPLTRLLWNNRLHNSTIPRLLLLPHRQLLLKAWRFLYEIPVNSLSVLPGLVYRQYRTILTVCKHICADEALSSAFIAVRIEESFDNRIIIAGLQIVEAGFGVVVVAAIAEGVNACHAAGGC